uniref:Putative pleckstrin similarity domain protein n=1 Tax=Nyssomyia neivai TaxID=330878 RepID=A0A1L8DV35_9DIPT
MAVLLRNVTNSIWHAFSALHQEQDGMVNKTKLKVLTANLATLLDLYGVERGLDHFRSTATLNFEHFKFYLAQEVFSCLPNTLTLSELRNHEAKIDEICWLVCRQTYTIQRESSIYPEEVIYKLFRIFCMFSDLVVRNDGNCHVLMHSSEAVQIVQQLLNLLGLDYEAEKKYEYLVNSDLTYRFDQFLSLVEFREVREGTFGCIESLYEAVDEIYQIYIKDIIKKGYLLRRGYLLPTLREYWFVLQPCELSYYKTPHLKELCGSICLDSNCMVKPFMSPSGKHEKVQRFIITSGERNFELAAHDHRSRMQWIAALQLAITYSAGKEGFQRDLTARRRQQRDATKQKRREEELERSTHIQEVEEAKVQLAREKMARVAAETQAKEFEAIAREDSRRVAELEDMKLTLEKLLMEETQAKRDEEIVRALQARVLSDEWEKRTELEQLQEEQRMLLEQERQKRMEFEVKQKEKENQLKEAEKRLKELEDERQKLDIELNQSRCKIKQSEETKEMLEARLQSMQPPTREGSRVRRALSFMPSTRERPTGADMAEKKAAAIRRSDKIISTKFNR